MFGAPGEWVYLYAAGLTQAPDSIGFEHALFVPPPKLLEQAANGATHPKNTSTISQPLQWGSASKMTMRGTFSVAWNLPAPPRAPSCVAGVGEGQSLMLGCPGGGKIESVEFLEFGTATGACPAGFKYGTCGVSLVGNASSCVGKATCVVSCTGYGKPRQGTCTVDGKKVDTGNECYHAELDGQVRCSGAPPAKPGDMTLTVKVHLPVTSVGTTVIPLLGSAVADVTVTEGDTSPTSVWKNGKYVAGVEGITGATATTDGVAIEHVSGAYSFRRTG